MIPINPNDPAFPIPGAYGLDEIGNLTRAFNGMSIRTQLAAMAMQGLLASGNWENIEATICQSIRYADTLIVELNKTSDK